jgi:hypothetical protein
MAGFDSNDHCDFYLLFFVAPDSFDFFKFFFFRLLFFSFLLKYFNFFWKIKKQVETAKLCSSEGLIEVKPPWQHRKGNVGKM